MTGPFLKESVCKLSLKGTQEISLTINQTTDGRQAPPALRRCAPTQTPSSFHPCSLLIRRRAPGVERRLFSISQ